MHNIIRLGDQVLAVALLSLLVMMIVACTPTVKVESPQEPITINLNIKLDADIRVKLEEEAKKDIAANPDVF
ncbi:MAG: YnbE family lipoprotein [Nitrosomonas sp.]|nr:YnbE family lipoprotein [Nitrosomonas sp.]